MVGLTRVEKSTSVVAYWYGQWIAVGDWQVAKLLSQSIISWIYLLPPNKAANFPQSMQFK